MLKREFANVLQEPFGMDMDAQKNNFVRMESNGIFSSSFVNVLNILIGTEHIVWKEFRVKMEWFPMEKMDANVPKEHIGMADGVKLLDVLVAKSGIKDKSVVSVKLDITSMVLFVYFVLMGKNGMIEINHVNAHLHTCGMETIVKKRFIVQVIEFTMSNISNVYVNQDRFGMATVAWSGHNAAVDKYGTKRPSLVTVLKDFNMMDIIVFYVSMEKVGIPHKKNVCVEKELNGMESSVLLFKIVMEDQFGIRTHGLVNVL